MAKSNKIKLESLSKMRSKYGSGSGHEILIVPDDHIWLPSSMLALNHQLGGGIPYGRHLELFGMESSGKSLIAMNFAAVAQSLGGIVLWADAERSSSHGWLEANNISLEDGKIEIYPENTIEYISDWLRDMALYWRSKLDANQPILFVLDSIAATDTKENQNMDQVDKKAEMGNRAKAMDLFLRGRNDLVADLGLCGIFINQLRKKLGAGLYEDPDTTPGGQAMKFYASQRLGVYRSKQIKDGDDVVGALTSIRVKKNKVAPPRATLSKVPMYTAPEYEMPLGLDKYHGLDDLGLKAGIITKAGMKYVVDDIEICGKRDDIVNGLRHNSVARKKVIKALGINTASTTRRKIKSLNHNLYPVANYL